MKTDVGNNIEKVTYVNNNNLNKDKEKFVIVEKTKNLVIELEKVLATIPKKDIFTKNMIYRDALELLELIHNANYTSDIEKKKEFQIRAISKINMMDFYFERAFALRYISEKKCLSITKKLDELNRMLYTWCNNGKSKN